MVPAGIRVEAEDVRLLVGLFGERQGEIGHDDAIGLALVGQETAVDQRLDSDEGTALRPVRVEFAVALDDSDVDERARGLPLGNDFGQGGSRDGSGRQRRRWLLPSLPTAGRHRTGRAERPKAGGQPEEPPAGQRPRASGVRHTGHGIVVSRKGREPRAGSCPRLNPP